MPSPFLNQATDGTDPGVHFADFSVQIAIARSGDRRGATRSQYIGSFEGAAYPLVYHNLTVPTRTGTQYLAVAGGTAILQGMINSSVPGDEIILPAGVSNKIIGSLTFPPKIGADTTPGGNNVVVLKSSALASLPYGLRVVGQSQALERGIAPTDPELFAHLQGSGNGPTLNITGNGYRLEGVVVTSDPALLGSGNQISRIILCGTGNAPPQDTDAEVPKNVVISRSYVHSFPGQWMLHAVDWQCENSYNIDSDISDIKNGGSGDCQAVVSYNSNGFLANINCFLEATDEGLVLGGGNNAVGTTVDCEQRWLMLSKPKKWNPNDATFDNQPNAAAPAWSSGTTYTVGQRVSVAGAPTRTYKATSLSVPPNLNKPPASNPTYWTIEIGWSIKLSAEIKKVIRALWEGCEFYQNWIGNQTGAGINIKNEYNDLVTNGHTADIIIKYCSFNRLGAAVAIAGGSYPPDKFAVRRVAIAHCLAINIGGTLYDHNNDSGFWVQSGGIDGLRCVHNTAFPSKQIHSLYTSPTNDTDGNTNNLTHRDNIYGAPSFARFKGGGQIDGKNSIDTYAAGGQFHGNVLIGANLGPTGLNFSTPDLSGNFTAVDIAAVQFTNIAIDDYSLSGTTQVASTTPPPPVLTSIAIAPTSASVMQGATRAFVAVGHDQYGAVIAFTPTWSVVAGGGTISPAGVFTAGLTTGTFPSTILAQSGAVSAPAATVTVTAAPVPPPIPVPTNTRRGLCGYYSKQKRL